MEPPVCEPSAARHMPHASAAAEPSAASHMPVAVAAAEPLLETPGVRDRSQGLRVTGGSKLAYCVVTVLPRKDEPAWRSCFTTGASARAMLWAHRFEPAEVGQSKTSK